MISLAQLAQSCDCTTMRAANWLGPISDACKPYRIDTADRIAAFLAQIAHESSRLRYVCELWGPTPAQTRYEMRRDLGNRNPGDGFRYRGRGLIQVTGRANYASARDALRKLFPDCPDFEVKPEALEIPKWAALSAAHFWESRGLNELADIGAFQQVTRRINGGLNGLADRLALWEKAKAAMGGKA